jgi:NAD(P)-dependent dehydrogenase (short-subunit alcohol dehydrogenase family)
LSLSLEDLSKMTVTKTALISGGARGIGRCLTRRFCERGYKVYVWDIDEDELTYTVKTHLASYYESGSLGFGLCNLGDTEDIRKQAGVAAEFLGGKIDVLVNNGAIAAPHWKDGKTMADFETLTQWRA